LGSDLEGISIDGLLRSEVAGTGVKGTDNILKFSTAIETKMTSDYQMNKYKTLQSSLRFPQTVLKTQLASRENYGTGNNMAY
jgi:hypothetical protein